MSLMKAPRFLHFFTILPLLSACGKDDSGADSFSTTATAGEGTGQSTGEGGANCGNGAIDTGEDCDGTNLNNSTCQDLDYTGGTLACDSTCQFDLTMCTGGGGSAGTSG